MEDDTTHHPTGGSVPPRNVDWRLITYIEEPQGVGKELEAQRKRPFRRLLQRLRQK